MDKHTFMVNRERAVDYLNSLDKVFVNDQFLNWDLEHRIKVRIVSARAYHSLFMHNMCIRPTPEELENFGTPDCTIYNAGQFPCNRYTHYMTSSTSIDLNLANREMVILGTRGAQKIRRTREPNRSHWIGLGRFYHALSLVLGTRKTTLSTDHNRCGCYAKCIDLAKEKEPDIWNAIKFGNVLENMVFDEHTREVDYTDKVTYTEQKNAGAAYPIENIPNAKIPCVGPHPKNVILLACDAFGVLPPVSKLSLAQTMYHFISGYTALVWHRRWHKGATGNVFGLLGAAFIMLHPTKHGSGSRIKLAYIPRKIIDAIHSGSLLKVNYRSTELFGLKIPTEVDSVPSEILEPMNTVSLQRMLLKLAGLFKKNFEVFVNHKIGKDDKLTEEFSLQSDILICHGR
ncbi:phosphoenolpyruvate carboxykinase 1 [Actinidia rufa]|uniref:phosphoenolpyruvate carboxykinase (ATP) n=1 Tax=Actinidia rufa TaxID=165716 RepID=A0A7J0H751_9ERIC|nr:phosphoenolpyruvate carboxykinase 1 [Actinidia rufa]